MLTVACVLKSGGIYDASWVARLRDGVARHLLMEHRFVCLSDVEVPCERIPLEHGWPGWWSKIELFSKLPGPALYFDLDTAIVDDLGAVAHAATCADFAILQDFYRGDGLGSGVMGWSGRIDVSALHWSFAKMADEWIAKLGDAGDQAFIEEMVLGRSEISCWQDIVPGQIVSYKVHCRRGIPAGARVVCLHGKPKFGEMPASDPVRMAWERAA